MIRLISKLIGKLFIVYCLLLIGFVTSLFLASSIPSELLKANVRKSLQTFKKEGIYPSYGLLHRQIVLDNFTDSVMINNAYSVDSENPLKSALTNIRYEKPGDTVNQIQNLQKLYRGDKDIVPVGYERYWHGYLVYLRPMLVFFSYSQIRVILSLFLYIGLFVLLWLLKNKFGKYIALAFLAGFVAVDFFYVGQSMQFSSVFLIGIYISIYLLIRKGERIPIPVIFFITGALTSFFDLLTAPMVGLGLVLIVTFLHEKISLKKIMTYCFFWAVGFLGLWASKWVIAQMLYSPAAMENALRQILDRTTSPPDANFSRLNAIKLNLFQLIGYDKTNKIFVLLAGIVGFAFLLKKLKISKLKSRLEQAGPWFLIAALPYFWYLVAANHVYLHVWFTYRNQLATVIALLISAAILLDLPFRTKKSKAI